MVLHTLCLMCAINFSNSVPEALENKPCTFGTIAWTKYSALFYSTLYIVVLSLLSKIWVWNGNIKKLLKYKVLGTFE